MWPELKKEISVEMESLDQLLNTHRELLLKCQSQEPNQVEVSALSAMLHSYYTGIENLFKRITLHLDGNLPHGEMWHSRLLDSAVHETPSRPSVISEELRDRLRDYLNFRHVFRHAYAFELRWNKMAPLVLDCEKTLSDVKQAVLAFAEVMDSRHK